jgi:hypothetical protein
MIAAPTIPPIIPRIRPSFLLLEGVGTTGEMYKKGFVEL